MLKYIIYYVCRLSSRVSILKAASLPLKSMRCSASASISLCSQIPELSVTLEPVWIFFHPFHSLRSLFSSSGMELSFAAIRCSSVYGWLSLSCAKNNTDLKATLGQSITCEKKDNK